MYEGTEDSYEGKGREGKGMKVDGEDMKEWKVDMKGKEGKVREERKVKVKKGKR